MNALGVLHVETASEGSSAYYIFRQTNFDIVMTKRLMVPLDGLDLARMIRNNARNSNSTVPILMLSASPSIVDVLEPRDAGVTEFMIKPFSVNDIYKRIVVTIEQPAQFVKISDYFDPDRRRSEKEFVGEERRDESGALEIGGIYPLPRR